jgi:hypothetical protein
VNPHQLGESILLQGVNFYLLSDLFLPSFWWLLTGLHLMIHPLYHALHPNRQLPIELIILHLLRLLREVPGFVSLGFAILIGRKNSLLRPLMMRSLAPWGVMLWSLMLAQRSCAKIYLSGHLFFDL